jgi:hypothetical protein
MVLRTGSPIRKCLGHELKLPRKPVDRFVMFKEPNPTRLIDETGGELTIHIHLPGCSIVYKTIALSYISLHQH